MSNQQLINTQEIDQILNSNHQVNSYRTNQTQVIEIETEEQQQLQQQQIEDNDETKRQEYVLEKDTFDKLKIIYRFFMTIFPTVFGLFDFALDINYVFVSGNFENLYIKYTAWFIFCLAPLISLIAWILLFTSEVRSKNSEGFQKWQKKYNEAKLKNSSCGNCRYIIAAYICQFFYEAWEMLLQIPKGFFYTFLQQLKILVIYIYTCSGYQPSYLITDKVLKEFEKNCKVLKNNHSVYNQNLVIQKENEEKKIHNEKEKIKYDQSQEFIKKIQQKTISNEEKRQKIVQSLYIPDYLKLQEENKLVQLPPPSKQVLLESGLYTSKNTTKCSCCCLNVDFMESVSQDSVLQSFLLIGDLIESAFESLPMLILQFINNSLTGWDFWDGVSFTSSSIMVIYSLIKIVSMLFDYKLTAAYEIFSILTDSSSTSNNNRNNNNKANQKNNQIIDEEQALKNKNKQKKEDIEENKISFQEYISSSVKYQSDKENQKTILQKSPHWFIGNNFDRSELLISEVEELQLLSKWYEQQFSRYAIIIFNFSNQIEPINLITKQKFKNLFKVIAQNVSKKNTISFNFYKSCLTSEDKIDIYTSFSNSQLSGYLFEEQFETVQMEEKVLNLIINQFESRKRHLRNIKLVFNEKHTIKYSDFTPISPEIVINFAQIMKKNLYQMKQYCEIENLQFSIQNTDTLFEDVVSLPQELSFISLNCTSLDERQLNLFKNLPNLKKLKLIQSYGSLQNIEQFLSNTPKLKELDINLQKNNIDNIYDIFNNLLNNTNLEKLFFDLSDNNISSISIIGEKLAINNDLTHLNMSLTNKQIFDQTKLREEMENMNLLKHLTLNFSGNQIKKIDRIGVGISSNNYLTHFNLNLQNNQVQNINKIGEGIGKNNNLTHFSINLSNNLLTDISAAEKGSKQSKFDLCSSIDIQENSIDKIGIGIGQNENLTHFEMNLSENKIININQIGQGIGKNTKMVHFKIDLGGNLINSIDSIGRGIGRNNNLTLFNMNVSNNQITDLNLQGEQENRRQFNLRNIDLNEGALFNNCIDIFGNGIGNNTHLTHLYLNLQENLIKNIDKLGESFKKNKILTHVQINLQYNKITNVENLSRKFGNTSKLKYFKLYLEGNDIPSRQIIREQI